MGPIVEALEAKYGKKAVFVKFYANTASHVQTMKSLGVKRIPLIRLINSKTEITGETTSIEKPVIEKEIQKILN